MRTRPRLTTLPLSGLSKPASRLSSVVLPQPEGPTTATNSPRLMSSVKSRRTSTPPNERQTDSRLSGLSLISPTYARDLRQLQEQAVDDDANHADDDHVDDQQVYAQAVARVPDGEAQAVLARDHLGG